MEDGLRQNFLDVHGDLLTAPYWRDVKNRRLAGEITHIIPYRRAELPSGGLTRYCVHRACSGVKHDPLRHAVDTARLRAVETRGASRVDGSVQPTLHLPNATWRRDGVLDCTGRPTCTGQSGFSSSVYVPLLVELSKFRIVGSTGIPRQFAADTVYRDFCTVSKPKRDFELASP